MHPRDELRKQCRDKFGAGAWISMASVEVMTKALADGVAPTMTFEFAPTPAAVTTWKAKNDEMKAAGHTCASCANEKLPPESAQCLRCANASSRDENIEDKWESKTVTQPAGQHYPCSVCGQDCASLADLNTHLDSHINSTVVATGTNNSATAPVTLEPIPQKRTRRPRAGRVVEVAPATAGATASAREVFGVQFEVFTTPRTDMIPPKDPTYKWDAVLAGKVAIALRDHEHQMLVGPRGCGKSTIVEQVAALMDRPVMRVSCHGEVTAGNFIGERTVDSAGQVVFQEGILPQCMREGIILILDEIAALVPEVLFVLQRVTEENGKLVLMEKNGEVIEPANGFVVMATCNDGGHGDSAGMYTGTHVLNASQLDRFGLVHMFDYMEPKQEVAVLKNRFPSLQEEMIKKLVEFAKQARIGRRNQEIFFDFSMRRCISFCKAMEKWATLIADDAERAKEALRCAVINHAGQGDKAKLAGLAQRHMAITV